jgi:hypothetical protein
MHSIETLFLLIKQFTPLTCSKEDINKLSNEIFILITNKILDYNIWYNRFKFYLKIQSSGELNNLVGYVKNHI